MLEAKRERNDDACNDNAGDGSGGISPAGGSGDAGLSGMATRE
jgi:hypothetical protein